MSSKYTSVAANILIGCQKRDYDLCDFTDVELESIIRELNKFWIDNTPEYWFDISLRCNTVYSMNIHIQCYNDDDQLRIVENFIPQEMIDNLCDSPKPIHPEGLWLEQQTLYVKFTPKPN